jgi:hypothetical protein
MIPDPKLQPVAYIQMVVAEEFELPRRIMTMPLAGRGGNTGDIARQAAYFVARMLLPHATAHLARQFNRDPRTFSHGVQRTWDRVQYDAILRRRVASVVDSVSPIFSGDIPCFNQMMRAKEGGPEVATLPIPTLAVGASQ